MSIYNINSIQNKLDLLNASYSDEYILQSLANLGQRLSVKGDSITTNTFKYNELFNSDNNFDENKYIGTIRLDNQSNNILFSIIDRSNFVPVEVTSIDYVDNALNIDNMGLEIVPKINDIVKYKDIIIKSSNFTHFIKLSGISKFSENDNIDEIYIYDINKYTNTITEGIKLLVYNIGNSKSIVLYHFVFDNKSNKYSLNFYINTSYTNLNDINVIINDLNASSCAELIKYLCQGIHNQFILVENEKKEQFVIDYTNKTFSVNNYFVALSNSLGISNLKTNIENLNNDINILYPYLKTLFSEKIYMDNNDSFKKQIVYELYKSILSNANANVSGINNTVYIPIDYSFEYYCNSNNIFEIYGNITDIIVKYIYDNITTATLDNFYNSNALLCNTNTYTKTATFNYAIEYDKTYNSTATIINKIHIIKQFTLPYINNDNMWVINDVETNICALGNDAGQPNILMIYNKSQVNNDFDILSGAKRDELKNFSNIKWELKTTFINPVNTHNSNNSNIITDLDLDCVKCWIPTLDETTKLDNNTITLLKYAIIISISSNNCLILNNEISKSIYTEDSLVTTFWAFDESYNEFKCINDPNGNFANRETALDLITLSNVNNYIKYHISNTKQRHPDTFEYNWLVFNKSYVIYKNETLGNTLDIYGTISNYKASDLTNESVEYDNDFNMIIKYTNNVSFNNDNYIINVGTGQQYKYLSLNSNRELKVPSTNRLYSYYDANTLNTKNYYEFTPNSNIPLLNLKEIFLQNTNILNRVNILSLDYHREISGGSAYIYNAYFGTSFEEIDKFTLHIGTSKTNINVGSETLLDQSAVNNFIPHSKLNIGLEEVDISGVLNIEKELNTYSTVNFYGATWDIIQLNKDNIYNIENDTNVNVNSKNYIPASKFMSVNDCNDEYLDYLTSIQLNNYTTTLSNRVNQYGYIVDIQLGNYYDYILQNEEKYRTEKINDNKLKLWVPLFYVLSEEEKIVSNKHLTDDIRKPSNPAYIDMFYLGDAIYLPHLLKRLELNDWFPSYINNSENTINVETNNDIIMVNHYPLFITTTNTFLSNETRHIDPINVLDKSKNIEFIIPNKIYIGNNLEITYYITDSKLNLTVNERKNNLTVSLPYNVNYNYNNIKLM